MASHAEQQQQDEDPKLSLSEPYASTLVSAFATFLTVSIHSLLFQRGLYAPETFITVRAFNLPIHQSRHPGVCKWINDAVAAVSAQLELGTVERIVLITHAPKTLDVLERWVFDVSSFPKLLEHSNDGIGVETDDYESDDNGGDVHVGRGVGVSMKKQMKKKKTTTKQKSGDSMRKGKQRAYGEDTGHDDEMLDQQDDEESTEESEEEEEEEEERRQKAGEEVNWVDVNESLRGALRRVTYAGERLPPLPKGSTFTLAVELRDEAEAPIGQPQPWIPIHPSHRKPGPTTPSAKKTRKTARIEGEATPQGSTGNWEEDSSTTPIRSVQAGPLFFECWVEKANTTPSETTPSGSGSGSVDDKSPQKTPHRAASPAKKHEPSGPSAQSVNKLRPALKKARVEDEAADSRQSS